MKLKKCLFTANNCYKANTQMKPTGIVVHSTGANNPSLKRYVQPLKTDSNYSAITTDIGVNPNGNHWNVAKPGGKQICVHAFIGKNAKGEVETYQVLPFNIACWGCGNGSKGSYNYNPQGRIQFEICEDNLTDPTYFNKVYQEAVEFCAYLCKQYGFGVEKISSHAGAHQEGYASNHGDPEHWFKRFGKTMDNFRADVKQLLNGGREAVKPITKSTIYYVQVGAFAKKENALAMVEKLKKAGFTAIIKAQG